MKDLDLLQKKVEQKMNNDPAHDFKHIMRVYKNAKKLCKKEKGNEKLVLSAALLHDIVSYPKTDKRSKNSSLKSADEATRILKQLRYSDEEIKVISDAIRDHSFSRGKTPKTLEGKILQDADRLDAIGAIGIASAGITTTAIQETPDQRLVDESIYFVRISYTVSVCLYIVSFSSSCIDHRSFSS